MAYWLRHWFCRGAWRESVLDAIYKAFCGGPEIIGHVVLDILAFLLPFIRTGHWYPH
jgi:hypothetical protein